MNVPLEEAAATAPLLRLRDVTVGAGDVRLLQGINFDLEAGERVALTGPSGCGKTTLLRCICGLDDAVAGDITLQGRDGIAWGWPQFRRKVLLVDQRPTLLDDSVRENLQRPFAYRAALKSFPHEHAGALLDRLGVGAHRMGQNAHSLSIGQQQRLCLIRALLLEPLVLLLDEPTSALDVAAAGDVEDVLREEAEASGLAALIVTHHQRQAEDWCHRRLDLQANAATGP